MKSIEQRMKALEEMVAEIHDVVVLGKKPPPPGKAEFDRAIEALIARDKKPLELYLQRGGEIPEPEQSYKPYKPRKRVEGLKKSD